MIMMYLSLIETEEDKSKFEEIYNQYRKLMFVCARAILKNNQLAEDAVHDSFLKLTSCMKGIDDVKCNKTKHFLIVIAENTAKDILRKEKYREYEDLEEMEEEGYVFSQYEMEELSDVEKAIMKLPLIYQHVFRLKYICGYSDTETAGILNITRYAVRKRVSRGKTQLAEILKDIGVEINEDSTGK